jgi:hypothetical protein
MRLPHSEQATTAPASASWKCADLWQYGQVIFIGMATASSRTSSTVAAKM